MELSQQIISAERKYKQSLEDFFTEVFRSTRLLSHGIDHHQRVWLFAKELLGQPDKRGCIDDNFFCDRLIIACYLHDSGMSIDPGPRHGIQSRSICVQFLLKYSLPESEFKDVLDVIEKHDKKEYSISDKPDELLNILSVADDLDAFGSIGIFRYLEIYLKRDIPYRDIGPLIIENISGRFNNFVRTYGFNQALIEKHRRRYETATSFFSNYTEQSAEYQFDTNNPTDYCGVAEVIRYMIRQNLKLPELFTFVKKFHNEKGLYLYFNDLKNELLLY
jgi:hypothetical protein